MGCGGSRVKIRVDDRLCMGHGRCYDLAPEVFTADEVGHGEVLRRQVADALTEKARLAEQNCPEGAIFLEEDVANTDD